MGVYDLNNFYNKLPEAIKDISLNEKEITFTKEELELMKQGDLFNGWPEDGEPVKKESEDSL